MEEDHPLTQQIQGPGGRVHLLHNQTLPHLIQVLNKGGQFLNLGDLSLDFLQLGQKNSQTLDIVLFQHHHFKGQLFKGCR